MASEESGEPVGVDLHDELRTWLQRTADDRGVDVETYVRELLAAHRAVESGDVEEAATVPADPVGTEEFDDRVEAVRSEFVELLEDVRSRVVQVKRETDGKAAQDHDHAQLEAELAELAAELDDLAADLEDYGGELDGLRSDLDEGFENFEEVLEHLLETTDGLADRVDRLARATLGTRERVQAFAGSVRRRERTDDLKRDAALEGTTSAECESCGRSVRAALLTGPECPYCAATFVDLEPKRGLLGSATWTTGDLPALTGGEDDGLTAEIEAGLSDDRPDPSDIDWDTAGGDPE